MAVKVLFLDGNCPGCRRRYGVRWSPGDPDFRHSCGQLIIDSEEMERGLLEAMEKMAEGYPDGKQAG